MAIIGNVNITNGSSGYNYTTGTASVVSPYYNNAAYSVSYPTTMVTMATSSAGSSGLSVSGDADIKGRLTVAGRDVTSLLETIEKRLAILVPDPALLKQYEALQQAYDHYKTLEALCVPTDKDRAKG